VPEQALPEAAVHVESGVNSVEAVAAAAAEATQAVFSNQPAIVEPAAPSIDAASFAPTPAFEPPRCGSCRIGSPGRGGARCSCSAGRAATDQPA
jgi:hypothetical protein